MVDMNRKYLAFHRPSIGEEEIKEVVEVLRSGWLTTGSKTKQFEDKFSEYVGSKHSVAVNSCTSALHLALNAIGLQENDEVILPTMTFAATGEVVTYFNAKPVLVDCEEDTLLIDPSKIEEKISKRTKAIIPVHYGGHACDMDKILEIARNYDLKVIEDAAHSLPTKYKAKMIGTVGNVTCFSFYATKTITTGEGGMACTDDDEFAENMRIMSLHGISKDAWKRYFTEGSWYYEVIEAGYKYNMTDIAAALGLIQLKKCDEFYQRRASIACKYSETLRNLPEIKTPVVRAYGTHAWHLYAIQLNTDSLKINRSQFIEEMKKNGIGCSVHFIPLHLHPFYVKAFGFKPEDFPVSTQVYERVVSLPIYPKMTDEEVEYVMQTIDKIIKNNRN